jgi:hypothetical protein
MTEGEVNNLRGSKNKLSIMIGNVIVGTPLKIDNDFSGLQTTWIEGFTIMRVLDYKEMPNPVKIMRLFTANCLRNWRKRN